MRKGTAVVCLEFQSTLLQEERPSRECGCTVSCRISIHAPTRGATVPLRAFHLGWSYFNPRSYKRSDHDGNIFAWLIIYFNPRSYKRSDLLFWFIHSTRNISIHAPTRGATTSCPLSQAPTRNFNPRSYKRSDFFLDKFIRAPFISIHAPTRGATFLRS